MRKHRSIILSLISFLMVLSSCTPEIRDANEEKNHDNPYELNDDTMLQVLKKWNPTVNIGYDENLDPQFDEIEPFSVTESQKLSSSMFDVSKDSMLFIHLQGQDLNNNSVNSERYNEIINDYQNYISINDANGQSMDLTIQSDGRHLGIQLGDSFDYGAVYVVNLDEDAGLQFEDRDPSIQRMVIEMEDDPSEPAEISDYAVKSNITVLDARYVSQEQAYEDSTFSFVYAEGMPLLHEGDIFQVKTNVNSEEKDITDFYGKFVSSETLGNGSTKVTYCPPEGQDIYDDFRLKGTQPFNLEGTKIIVTPNQVKDAIRYTDTARGMANFIAKYAETTNGDIVDTLMDHISIDLTFKWVGSTLNFQFSITVNKLKLKENLWLSFGYKFEQVTEYGLDFDVSLEKKWFVPVGVNYKIKCVEDITEAHTFFVTIDYVQDQPEKTDEEAKEDLQNEIKNAKGGQDNFFKKIVQDPIAKKTVEGNKTTFPLLAFPIPLFWDLVFELKLDFVFDFTLEAMLLFKKTYSSNQVLFSFSNKDGGDSDKAQTINGSSEWEIYFMGLAEVRIALRFTASIYFKGLYKYLHADVYAELWIKVGIQGTMLASWNTGTDGSSFSGNLAIDFYIQMGADIGLNFVLAIFDISLSKNLFKTYIFRFYLSNEIEHYADNTETSIELNQTVTKIDDYNILWFRVWDGVNLIMDEKKYEANHKTKILESWFGDATVKTFDFIPEDESLMKIDPDGTIKIPDGTPAEFTTSFRIHLHNAVSLVNDRNITVHFNAPDAHHVYIDDVDMGRIRPGVQFTLPEPEKRTGYRFLNYVYNETNYDIGDRITMQNEDIYITTEWHKILYYDVYFYDGKNNLVYVDRHVEEFTAATAPTPEVRDQHMQGYSFVGWDKNFSNVQGNLVVRGIYVKVGD